MQPYYSFSAIAVKGRSVHRMLLNMLTAVQVGTSEYDREVPLMDAVLLLLVLKQLRFCTFVLYS